MKTDLEELELPERDLVALWFAAKRILRARWNQVERLAADLLSA